MFCRECDMSGDCAVCGSSVPENHEPISLRTGEVACSRECELQFEQCVDNILIAVNGRERF